MAAAALVLQPPTLTPKPSCYHRIVSPTLRVPTDARTPVPVGLLACQRDPLLRELATRVVSARPAQASDSGKKKKSASDPGPLLEIILHDTVLFPEGGGQPSDVGVLATADGAAWEVVEVRRVGGHAVHYVRCAPGSATAFGVGEEVRVALGEEGWARRVDHMSMHTAQHVLSALLETHLALPTLSWSLPAHPSPAPGTVELPRALTPAETAQIQALAGQLAFEGRRVHVEVSELDGGEHGQLQAVEKLENGRAVGKGVPKDYTGGVKRVVVIDGVDRNPCCGTHLPSIHTLPLFLVPPLPTSSASSVRLSFLAGPRLLSHLGSLNALLASTAATLSCGAPLVPERVRQVVEERRRAEKRVAEVEGELAGMVAGELLKDMQSKGGDDVYAVHKHRTDDTPAALSFLSAIATSLVSSASGRYLLALSSSPSSQSAASTSVVLVFGSDHKLVREVGERLKQMGVKGGGKGGRWSGKFAGVWREREGAEITSVFVSSEEALTITTVW
ncbi:ThrRS/AlaRS common domain-containing protein [Gloeophyllum trabeum ATCC 11539]|uniref:ThrRS/AlaRS common domain-containing protein n=1 Tax=Gloeophyllum trabeum (strain ATCC 11539 / FP-39264 / Madison 617) TaxID=670483 RepID=S7QPL7_GLOTA|nr:ThrRS/AlaRS common domain-containing protein [Gloeophyllum trabeum ATCC 11539]EPQ61307.1 ThrRS/AlaRS common domain-containing protein [Gloeophyllum trabeum ATCC 11539]